MTTPSLDLIPRRVRDRAQLLAPSDGCELVAEPGEGFKSGAKRGRCRGKAVGVRWEDGFADDVCERHAVSAEGRGAVVVRRAIP